MMFARVILQCIGLFDCNLHIAELSALQNYQTEVDRRPLHK